MSSEIPKREIGSQSSSSSPPKRITRPTTLFPGEGMGPKIAESIKQVFEAAGVPTAWEEHLVGTEMTLESVRHKGVVGLKGPLTTPIGKHLITRSDKLRSPKQD